jgi:hypothetical protein
MLQQLMQTNYTIDNVVAEHKASFQDTLLEKTKTVDWEAAAGTSYIVVVALLNC